MLASDVTLVGNHPKFVKAIEFAKNLAVTKAPVLVVGESGTGKRAICQFIHRKLNESKCDETMVSVDCSQEAQKVENEVLGHRDAETGRFNKGVLRESQRRYSHPCQH
jgi:two-component system response regulator FlrC